ncbi:hypothetical protein HZA45_03765 [Candidatus Peregrinibacteria bacterium]|nr:hypothetical protein [Candidatus Peregrinibacteria bacterium]
MNTPRTLLIGFSVTLGTLTLAASASMAAPRSVVFNGNTYYVVNGNDPKMDTGDEVCASVGKVFDSYKSINTNAICKLLHPNARELTSVNGSKAGFYCNGAPQQGIACAPNKNTCQVCPACNLNEAAAGNSAIGQHFAEMYVWCRVKGAAASSSKKANTYGPLPMPKSASKASVRRIVTRSSAARSSAPSRNSITCTFSQQPLKKVTCGAYKAADTYCALVMQSTYAKSILCQDIGKVVCSIPCTAPGIQNFRQCAFGGVKSGSCPAPAASSKPALKRVGQTCQHGGECNTSYCVGVPDYYKGMQYFCSCSQWKYDTSCGK